MFNFKTCVFVGLRNPKAFSGIIATGTATEQDSLSKSLDNSDGANLEATDSKIKFHYIKDK